MPLIVLRLMYFLVAAGGAVSLVQSKTMPKDPTWLPWAIFGTIMVVSAAIVAIDWLLPRKRLDIISSVYFGLIVGLFLTYVVRLALGPVLPLDDFTRACIDLIVALVLCYTCISFLMQTRNDFRFVIPYVEFSKEVKGLKPYVLDTSVVIDGRIADVVETKVLDSQLIMPRFVLGELQAIADSSDRLRRSRGRRGLDILNRLRANPTVDLQIYDRTLAEFEGQPVDLKLVLLAKHLDGKVVTNDYNLNKVAKLHGVDVINLNDLANALKPLFLPGESLEVHLVKPGEEPGQGVGYLDDGTMIVVEGGREHLNRTVKVAVTSVLQTSAGRMIFGRCDSVVRRDGKDG
ncbi:MAG TPA: PIN domain-containing protein [Pirellulales bacterium]|nr:PIN domain-containing protein [Pirellulales bacterium]